MNIQKKIFLDSDHGVTEKQVCWELEDKAGSSSTTLWSKACSPTSLTLSIQYKEWTKDKEKIPEEKMSLLDIKRKKKTKVNSQKDKGKNVAISKFKCSKLGQTQRQKSSSESWSLQSIILNGVIQQTQGGSFPHL